MQLLIPSQKLSTNDVLSAVLWHVACDIRGRPRPYQPSCAGHGCLAYPLNLRSMHVPQQYCGNALLVNLLGGMTLCLAFWVFQALLQFADFWAPDFVRCVCICLDPTTATLTPPLKLQQGMKLPLAPQQSKQQHCAGCMQLECFLVHLRCRHNLLTRCMLGHCSLMLLSSA